ncbi:MULTISPECIES: GNAT family N-acetyltransferase [unclassified Paenibacillus]|uniref:GNAT family N-acetyltransferase n=1 Tax=unclassified Paenibacillus TaxID=185978 RepID=UPI00039027D2|nr:MULTISPECIES: GNAT family N-acetyltransferase [unclassified Paenibacillus]CDN41799.1 GCN5-related N-acetyltransferase [Paenibacillus sp. P22]
MKTSIHYRPMNERKDLDGLVRLIRTELLPLSYSTETDDPTVIRSLPGRFRDGRTIVAVAGKKGEPAGFVHYQFLQGILHIDMLAVHRDCRNAGVGGSLMKQAEAAGAAEGCVLALLFVDDANDKARRFYERIGYEPVRHHESYKVTELLKPL